MKIEIDTEKKFILLLTFTAFLLRLIIAPFLIRYPDLPHDFPAYVNAAENVIQGTLYANATTLLITSPNYTGPYGPLLGMTFAPILFFFGRDYFLMKFPSILLDSLSIIIVYSITKNIKNADTAKYVSVFYAFSYLSLFSSAGIGNNDSFEVFFALLAVYFLIVRTSILLSAIFLGISMGYVFISMAMIPAILYYLYKLGKFKEMLAYLLITFSTLGIILFPFYLSVGSNVLYPYFTAMIGFYDIIETNIDGMGIIHLIKMLLYYFIFGADKPYNTYLFPNEAAWITFAFGLLFAVIYIIKFRLMDKKLELIRNIFIILIVGLVFHRNFYFPNMPWILPFVLILSFDGEPKFSLSRYELFGIGLVIASIVIHTAIYHEYMNYNTFERTIIALGIPFAAAGTYFTMIKSNIRASWSAVMLAGVTFNVMDARILTLLGGFIPILQVSRFSWGFNYFATIVLMLAGLFWLFIQIHTITMRKSE